MPDEPATTQADALLDRALDHMAAGQPEAAIPHLRQALNLAPSHPAATHALLRALEDTHQFEEALALTHRRLAEDPEDILAHTRLSILLQKLNRIPEAEAAAAQAKILGWRLQLRQPDPSSKSGIL